MSGLMQSSSAPSWLGSQGSSSGLIVKRTIRVDIPVDQFPNVQILLLGSSFLIEFVATFFTCILCLDLQYNFVGRLLGPRGNSLKRVEATTECRVLIRGRGSIKDPTRVY